MRKAIAVLAAGFTVISMVALFAFGLYRQRPRFVDFQQLDDQSFRLETEDTSYLIIQTEKGFREEVTFTGNFSDRIGWYMPWNQARPVFRIYEDGTVKQLFRIWEWNRLAVVPEERVIPRLPEKIQKIKENARYLISISYPWFFERKLLPVNTDPNRRAL